jgi:serine/threonine protein kinase
VVAESFHFFHQKKLLVNNMDLSQILIGSDFQIKVDLFKYSQPLKYIQRNKIIIGNICTLAPEHFGGQEGHLKKGFKIDSYLFGVIAVWILSGELPFAQMTLFECMSDKTQCEYDVPKSILKRVDKKFFKLLQKCFSLDPLERISMLELCEFFKKISARKVSRIVKERVIQPF